MIVDRRVTIDVRCTNNHRCRRCMLYGPRPANQIWLESNAMGFNFVESVLFGGRTSVINDKLLAAHMLISHTIISHTHTNNLYDHPCNGRSSKGVVSNWRQDYEEIMNHFFSVVCSFSSILSLSHSLGDNNLPSIWQNTVILSGKRGKTDRTENERPARKKEKRNKKKQPLIRLINYKSSKLFIVTKKKQKRSEEKRNIVGLLD